jgi:hypothetical protein
VERLRKIAARLAASKEKVVFVIVVGVLIWRVVQIVLPGGQLTGGITLDDLMPPKDPIKPPVEEPEKFAALPNEHISTYAEMNVSKWNLPGQSGAPATSAEDIGMPEIKLETIKEIGGIIFAKISVDGRTETKAKGQSFAGGRAVLDEIHEDENGIVFTWVASDKQYERVASK